MATKEQTQRDLQKVTGPQELPNYLAELAKEDTSLAELRQERVLSRIKVIHGSAGPELKKLFSEGDVIVSPGQTLIANVIKEDQMSESWLMVPLLFFMEYCKWKDIKDTNSPTILARTFDKGNDLATMAKDPAKREEKYGENDCYTARYIEHLNFVSMIVGDHPLANQMEPFILGFCKGEWMIGKNFITTLARLDAPLWSTVWKFNASFRSRNNFNWWGIDYTIPDLEKDKIGRFITEDQVDLFKSSHEELKKLLAERMLIVDRSDMEEVVDDLDTETEY